VGPLFLPEVEAVWGAEGFGPFRDTWCVAGATLDDAQVVIAAEEETLQSLDTRARGVAEFNELCRELERNANGPGNAVLFRGLEIGVAGLVTVLNALGMPTAASCRGHPDKYAWSEFPVVRFVAERARADCLFEISRRRAECGFVKESDDTLTMWFRSTDDANMFARHLLSEAGRFQEFSRPYYSEAPGATSVHDAPSVVDLSEAERLQELSLPDGSARRDPSSAADPQQSSLLD
jgi:hypothetical protein